MVNSSSPVRGVSEMVESVVVPLNVTVDSNDSDANSEFEASLGLKQGSAMKEIFSAAQQISSRGHIEAANER